jgi:hypothetical protein
MKHSHRLLTKLILPLCCSFGVVVAMFGQRPFRQYPSVEYGESTPLPSDFQRPGEWAFARLMYPPGPNDGYRGRFDGEECHCGRRMGLRPIVQWPLPCAA